MASVEFNPELVLKAIRPRVTKGVEAVAVASKGFMEDSISTLFPPASLVGYPPHLRTGYLKSKCYAVPYSASTNSVTWRVGNDAEYALPLELGTANMGARPFISRTFYQFTMKEGPAIFAAEVSD